MKKKLARMTFKEFFDLARDEETRQLWLEILKEEGFTEEQVNRMKITKAFDLLGSLFATASERYEYALFKALQEKTLTQKDLEGSKEILKSTEKLIQLLKEEEKRLKKLKEKEEKKG